MVDERGFSPAEEAGLNLWAESGLLYPNLQLDATSLNEVRLLQSLASQTVGGRPITAPHLTLLFMNRPADLAADLRQFQPNLDALQLYADLAGMVAVVGERFKHLVTIPTNQFELFGEGDVLVVSLIKTPEIAVTQDLLRSTLIGIFERHGLSEADLVQMLAQPAYQWMLSNGSTPHVSLLKNVTGIPAGLEIPPSLTFVLPEAGKVHPVSAAHPWYSEMDSSALPI